MMVAGEKYKPALTLFTFLTSLPEPAIAVAFILGCQGAIAAQDNEDFVEDASAIGVAKVEAGIRFCPRVGGFLETHKIISSWGELMIADYVFDYRLHNQPKLFIIRSQRMNNAGASQSSSCDAGLA